MASAEYACVKADATQAIYAFARPGATETRGLLLRERLRLERWPRPCIRTRMSQPRPRLVEVLPPSSMEGRGAAALPPDLVALRAFARLLDEAVALPGTRRRVGRVVTIPVQALAAQDAFNQTVIATRTIFTKAAYSGRRRVSRIIINPTTGQLEQSIPVILVTYTKSVLIRTQRRRASGLVGASQRTPDGVVVVAIITYAKPFINFARGLRRYTRGSWSYTGRSGDDLVFQEDTRPPITIVKAARSNRWRPAGRIIQTPRSVFDAILEFVIHGGGGHGVFRYEREHWHAFKDEQIDRFKNRFENKPRRRLK